MPAKCCTPNQICYKYSTKIPGNIKGVYFYVGIGYPNYAYRYFNGALPKFRYANF